MFNYRIINNHDVVIYTRYRVKIVSRSIADAIFNLTVAYAAKRIKRSIYIKSVNDLLTDS